MFAVNCLASMKRLFLAAAYEAFNKPSTTMHHHISLQFYCLMSADDMTTVVSLSMPGRIKESLSIL